MDTTSAPAAPLKTPEEREPRVNWDLLRKLAAHNRVITGVSADGRPDPKPSKVGPPARCRGCNAKYPGGAVCGCCRGRIAELRKDMTAGSAGAAA